MSFSTLRFMKYIVYHTQYMVKKCSEHVRVGRLGIIEEGVVKCCVSVQDSL